MTFLQGLGMDDRQVGDTSLLPFTHNTCTAHVTGTLCKLLAAHCASSVAGFLL